VETEAAVAADGAEIVTVAVAAATEAAMVAAEGTVAEIVAETEVEVEIEIAVRAETTGPAKSGPAIEPTPKRLRCPTHSPRGSERRTKT
jgi:hypothetical protein